MLSFGGLSTDPLAAMAAQQQEQQQAAQAAQINAWQNAQQRDAAIMQAVQSGAIYPGSLEMVPVELTQDLPQGYTRAEVQVGQMPFAVMTENGPMVVPASANLGESIVSELGYSLPTRAIVDAMIEQGTPVYTNPQSPGPGMTGYDAVRAQSDAFFGAVPEQYEGPIAGGYKNILRGGDFYGWAKPGGGVRQPRASLANAHNLDYADYSHAFRPVGGVTLYDDAGNAFEATPEQLQMMGLGAINPVQPQQSGNVLRGQSAPANPLVSGILETAQALEMDPVDLATIISYETGGTFDPAQPGPTTQWGQHRGLIQFGEPQARQYGVDWNDPLGSQLGADGAIVRYYRENGWQPGMGILDAYSIVNAGGPGLYNRSDANNGGAWGTVADKVNHQMGGHREKAIALLSGHIDPSTLKQSPPPRATNGGTAYAAAGSPSPTGAPQRAGNALRGISGGYVGEADQEPPQQAAEAEQAQQPPQQPGQPMQQPGQQQPFGVDAMPTGQLDLAQFQMDPASYARQRRLKSVLEYIYGAA